MALATKAMTLAFILSATDKMSRVISDATKKSNKSLSSFERTSASVGASFMKKGLGMVATGGALGGAVLNLSKQTAQYGDDAWKTSQKVGVGVEDWQKMAYAAKFSGVEQDQLAAGMVKLNKKMVDASRGSKEAAQTFTDLGIKLKDSKGNLRAPNEVLGDVAKVFSKVKGDAAKTALAVDLFGKSGADLIPLLNTGKDGLQQMGDEAVRTGNVLSEDAAKACEEFNDNLDRLTARSNGLKNQFSAAMIPILDKLVTKFGGVIEKVSGWVSKNPRLAATVGKVALVVSGLLIGLGSLTVFIGGVIFSLGKFVAVWRAVALVFNVAKNSMLVFRIQYAAFVVWQKLATAAQWLFNTSLFGCPIVWIVAGIAVLVAAAVLLVKNWDAVSAFFKRLWEGIKQVFSSALGWVKGFFAKWGVEVLAVAVPFIGLPLLIRKHWDKITAFFTSLWGGVKRIFFAAWEGIKSGFSAAWGWIKKMFLNYHPLGLVVKHWDKVKSFFASLWDKVKRIFSGAWVGIKSFFSSLNPLEWISSVFANVEGFFTSLRARFFEWGGNIIQGLIDGIVNFAGRIWETIANIGKSIGESFCNVLGIHSPSRLFMEYGVNITQGLTGGLTKGEAAVGGATEGLALQAVQGVSASIQTGAVSTSSMVNNAGSVSLNYSPTVNISGNVAEGVKADFSKALREHSNEVVNILERYLANKARLSFG